ncbi:MAG: tRNA (N6-threonylcarbamoyladenosine(37)-N6)-methyltransferase TrmO [Tannerella sp.]|jgi:formylmethanofuran dehydrogenase subunit E|nr:tRNA (N6-threonylcarbamoyladenosine(37)-N6)-methyltransferase TrmO [Tannerella sp.]
MEKITFTPIGKVSANPAYDYDTPLRLLKSETSRLQIFPAYAEALLGIEECTYIDVIFYFDRLRKEAVPLTVRTASGAERGIFALRTPRRPNLIGVTTVRLLEVDGNELIVEGLDALDGTPVLDIKRAGETLIRSADSAGCT